MSDIAGQESTSEYTEAPEAPEAPQTEDHSTGNEPESNPFWGEVEKLTGPNVYKIIQPHLAKADTAARQRVEAVNQSFAPWKELEAEGINPQQVRQAMGVVQQLNTNPEQVYQSLQEFLTREGRMPNQAELKREVAEDIQDEENGNQPDPRDAQLAALKEQIERLGGFVTQQFTSQQQQAAAQEADSWLEGEAQRLTQTHGYSAEDMKEIVRIAAFQAQQTGQDPDNLDAAAAHFNSLRDRFRTAPRPGASAPRLPMGPGGGSPQQTSDPASLSKEDRIAAAAAVLQRNRG